jgi:hypothetical protein
MSLHRVNKRFMLPRATTFTACQFDRVKIMGVQDQAGPQIIDGLELMRAFFKIEDPTDRRKVIELAAALARAASPPIAPR